MDRSGPERMIADAVAQMQQGWNACDGATYAAPFHEDADFVDIRGAHHKGRSAIAGGHAGVLRSIYKDSRIAMTLMTARPLSDAVWIAHVESTLECPEGPMKGESRATMSIVVDVSDQSARILAAHNTLHP